jgi:lysozyme
MTILESLIPRLKVSEGWRSHAYVDTTSNLTIGYGHNLANVEVFTSEPADVRNVYPVKGGWLRVTPVNGIGRDIGEQLLTQEVVEVMARLEELLPWYLSMDEVRREVLIELCFNIGLSVLGYKVFVRQLIAKDYAGAAENMRGWRWRRQVGDGRALPLIRMMETGLRA